MTFTHCPTCGKKLVHAIDISNREKKHIIYCTQPDCFDYQGEGDTEEGAIEDLKQKRSGYSPERRNKRFSRTTPRPGIAKAQVNIKTQNQERQS